MIDDQILVENAKFIHRVSNDRCSKPFGYYYGCNVLSRITFHNTRNANLTIHRRNPAIVNRSLLCKTVIDWQKLESRID